MNCQKCGNLICQSVEIKRGPKYEPGMTFSSGLDTEIYLALADVESCGCSLRHADAFDALEKAGVVRVTYLFHNPANR